MFRKRLSTPFRQHFAKGWPHAPRPSKSAKTVCPKHWEEPYGTGRIHAALTLLSISESKWQEKLALARQQLQDLPAVQVLKREDFAQVQGRPHAVRLQGRNQLSEASSGTT